VFVATVCGTHSSIDLPAGLSNRPAQARAALREKTKLLRRINLFLPVQSRLKKYSGFPN